MVDHKGVKHAGKWFAGVLAPRGSWKTGVGTIGDAIWEVVHDANTALQICAESQETGKKFLAEIKGNFEENNTLRYFYGEHVSDRKWSATELNSAQRTEVQKEPTIEVLGVGGRIVGRRAKKQYMDDCVSMINSATDHLRKKLYDWYCTVFEPILNPGGTQVMRGTRYYPRDLYYSLIRDYGPDYMLRIPGLTMNAQGEYQSYWPERFPVEDLLVRRKTNPQSFALSIQNDCALMMSQIINTNMLRIVKDSELSDPNDTIAYMGVDPARKVDGPGSWFAIASIAQNQKTGRIDCLREVVAKLATPDKMCELIAKEYWHMRERGYAVQAINIEDNGFQGVLANQINAEPMKYGCLPIIPCTTIVNKDAAFINNARWINAGHVVFAQDAYRLLEDIAGYPDCEVKDRVDAWGRAVELIDKVGSSAFTLDIHPYEITGSSNFQIFG